jgi:hypothetical protein
MMETKVDGKIKYISLIIVTISLLNVVLVIYAVSR